MGLRRTMSKKNKGKKDMVHREIPPDEGMIAKSLEELRISMNMRLMLDAGQRLTADLAEAAVPQGKVLWVESITVEYAAAEPAKQTGRAGIFWRTN